MGQYRNRPDRRVAPPNPVQPISNPIMLFTAASDSDTNIIATFDQNIIPITGTEVGILNSAFVWHPEAGYQGHPVSVEMEDVNKVRFVFAGAGISGEDAMLCILDGLDFFRGRVSGARCTGNPVIFTMA